MEGLSLLQKAREAGLTIETDGDELVIRGPKRAEAVAQMLLDQKSSVLAALAPEPKPHQTPRKNTVLAPDRPCWVCHGVAFWRHADHGHWLCARCHPPSFTQDVGEEVTVADPRPRAEWEAGDAELVAWFLEVGQHKLPGEPFALTDWISVTNPARFRESILFDISCGPDGPRARTGAIQDEIRRVRDKIDPSRKGQGK